MRHRSRPVSGALLLSVALAACEAGGDGRADATGARADDASSSASDARTDAGSRLSDADEAPRDADGLLADADAPRDAAAPDATTAPQTLPLGRDAITTIGSGPGIEVYGATFLDNSGGANLVFEHYTPDFSAGELRLAHTADGRAFDTPTPLALGARAFTGAPSSAGRWLYFVEAASLQAAPAIARVSYDGRTFATAREAVTVRGVASLLSWPRFVRLADGRIAVAFRDGRSRPSLAVSEDGLAFGAARTISTEAGAQPMLGAFASGALAFTYQTPGAGGAMTAYVTTSSIGATWAPRERVSDASANVHDTTLLLREDGRLDLYYIYPAGGAGFSIFRRALALDGALGPEQAVSAPAAGDLSKPEAVRLADGRILLTFATITQRDGQGLPSEQVLEAMILEQDAP